MRMPAARVSSARGPKADIASSTVPPHKRRRTAASPHVDKADRIFEKAAAMAVQKALMQQAKEAADRTDLGTKGAALKTLLRRTIPWTSYPFSSNSSAR